MAAPALVAATRAQRVAAIAATTAVIRVARPRFVGTFVPPVFGCPCVNTRAARGRGSEPSQDPRIGGLETGSRRVARRAGSGLYRNLRPAASLPNRWRRTQGADPLRRRRDPPAPDHPYLGQAARPGGQQARALLRDRGAGRRRGSPRSGSSSPPRPATRSARRPATARRSAPRSPTSRRTSRPGSPTRCSPPRTFLGDVAVRHVPRRQPAARRDHRPGRRLPRARARRADPAHPGPRPVALRRRRAQRRHASSAWSRSRRTRPATWRSSASTCSRRRSSTRRGRSSPPAAASSRSPTRSSS